MAHVDLHCIATTRHRRAQIHKTKGIVEACMPCSRNGAQLETAGASAGDLHSSNALWCRPHTWKHFHAHICLSQVARRTRNVVQQIFAWTILTRSDYKMPNSRFGQHGIIIRQISHNNLIAVGYNCNDIEIILFYFSIIQIFKMLVT